MLIFLGHSRIKSGFREPIDLLKSILVFSVLLKVTSGRTPCRITFHDENSCTIVVFSDALLRSYVCSLAGLVVAEGRANPGAADCQILSRPPIEDDL